MNLDFCCSAVHGCPEEDHSTGGDALDLGAQISTQKAAEQDSQRQIITA